MVKKILFLFFSLNLFAFGGAKGLPQPNKGSRAFVKDIVDILTEKQEIYLCEQLEAHFDSTSNQIVVLINNSTGGIHIFNYSVDIAENWGIGEGKEDNGILIYIALEDSKVFIQVGRGLEGAVTDNTTKKIIKEVLIPNMKREQYFTGIEETVNRIIGHTEGEYINHGQKPDNGFPVWIAIALFIILFIIITAFGKNDGVTYRGNGHYPQRPFFPPNIGGGRGGNKETGGFGGFGGGSFGGGGAGGSW